MMIKKVLLSSALALGFTTFAQANTFTFTDAGVASAIITTNDNGTLTVSLTSLATNPISDASELSGIIITLGSSAGTDKGFDAVNGEQGTLINIGSSGVVSAAGGSITHWGTSASGSTVCLETVNGKNGNPACAAGGQPTDLIIGNNTAYTNANPSIIGKDPQIQGTATFIIDLTGVTSATNVTGVSFETGTSGNDFSSVLHADAPAVPEPSSLMLLGTGLAGMAEMIRRRARS